MTSHAQTNMPSHAQNSVALPMSALLNSVPPGEAHNFTGGSSSASLASTQSTTASSSSMSLTHDSSLSTPHDEDQLTLLTTGLHSSGPGTGSDSGSVKASRRVRQTVCEQQRRAQLATSFDRLKALLPELLRNAPLTKQQIIDRAADVLEQNRKRMSLLEQQVAHLEHEKRSLLSLNGKRPAPASFESHEGVPQAKNPRAAM